MLFKRMIAAVVICCMLLFCALSAASALQTEPYIIGDADGDGAVTVLDATIIQRVLADLAGDSDGGIALRGNVTSGGLNILDATNIPRFLACLPTECLIGETVVPETQPPTQKPTTSYELPFVPI